MITKEARKETLKRPFIKEMLRKKKKNSVTNVKSTFVVNRAECP